MTKAVYEGALTEPTHVEIVGQYLYENACQPYTKYVCRVTKGNYSYPESYEIHTPILWLWAEVNYVGYSVQYLGKPDVSNIPQWEGLKV